MFNLLLRLSVLSWSNIKYLFSAWLACYLSFQYIMPTPYPHLIPTHANFSFFFLLSQLTISSWNQAWKGSFLLVSDFYLTFLLFIEDRDGQVNSKTEARNVLPWKNVNKQQRNLSQDVQDAGWLGNRSWHWACQTCDLWTHLELPLWPLCKENPSIKWGGRAVSQDSDNKENINTKTAALKHTTHTSL